MPPEIISEVFKLRDSHCYNLRHTLHYFTDPILGVYNGTESASYAGPKIWEQIPAEIKIMMFLNEKSKNGNLLDIHVEFVGRLYLI